MLFILRLQKRKFHDRELAKADLQSLFHDFNPNLPKVGPLQTEKGILWLEIDEKYFDEVIKRSPRLGYFREILILEEHENGNIKFQNKKYSGKIIYSQNKEELKNRSADKREFLVETTEGLKRVKGFRGDGSESGPKALPVIEAKLLVNLAFVKDSQKFLDPFAGIGGIVLEAIDSGFEVYSSDLSEKVAAGLKEFGSTHFIADAKNLPFEENHFDAIATEFPFAKSTHDEIPFWLAELKRVTKESSPIVIMCTFKQANILKSLVKNKFIDLDFETKRGGKEVRIIRIINHK